MYEVPIITGKVMQNASEEGFTSLELKQSALPPGQSLDRFITEVLREIKEKGDTFDWFSWEVPGKNPGWQVVFFSTQVFASYVKDLSCLPHGVPEDPETPSWHYWSVNGKSRYAHLVPQSHLNN